jgi:xylulokinase
MDPTNRLLWWHEVDPRTIAKARWFLGWHELASLRLVGRPVVDPALAAGFLIFDLSTRTWSPERLAGLGLDDRVLPDVVAWGTSLGPIRPTIAAEMGLPSNCAFVVGSWDSACAAVGTAVVEEGGALVAAGTWESVVAPLARPRLLAAARNRLALTPQPSAPGLGLWARSPNGTSVLDWARAFGGVRLPEVEVALAAAGPDPTSVLVIPHLSGTPAPWPERRGSTGTILGVTLATSPLDLVRSAMEGIAVELTFAIDALREGGARIVGCVATGGGARSAWWMQLKADLLGMPVEVSDQLEPGTLGAALLAGLGVGTFRTLEEAAASVRIARRFEPDEGRRDRYREKVERHRTAVASLAERSSP